MWKVYDDNDNNDDNNDSRQPTNFYLKKKAHLSLCIGQES